MIEKSGERNLEKIIRRMQDIELELLHTVDNICNENNIKYFLIGGTLLGAVRHKGFIPWDDDIDIGMSRKDYDRFINICKNNMPDNTKLLTYDTVDNYPHNFAKIIDTRTVLIEENLKHLNVKSGVFIDVFPFDGVPENGFMCKLHYLSIRFYKYLLAGHYFTEEFLTDKEYKSSIARSVKIIMVKIIKLLTRFTDIKKVHKKLNKLLSKYEYDSCKIVCNYLGAWGVREIVPKYFIGKGERIQFEGSYFSAIDHPDLYLESIYGDYMKLPPEEKRKSHHKFAVLELNCDVKKVEEPNQPSKNF